MLSFVGKHLSFYPKDVCFFAVFFLNEKELSRQVCLIKYAEDEICNSPLTKKRKEQKQSNFKNIFKTPEKFSLVILVTNYHKFSLLPLVVRP